MSTCTMRTGFLLWRKFCGEVAIGNCRDCRAFVCERHSTRYGDGAVACSQCVARVDDDDSTGTVFSSGPLAGPALGAAAGAAAAAEPARADTWHGGEGSSAESSSGDTAGGDSGGGDSGGGDSGSSSTD